MALEAALKARIKRAYVTPGHPVAYSAPARVAKHFHISQNEARAVLEEIEGYRLHREYKKPRVYNPYFVHGRREQVQADLFDISKIARHNNGINFCLLLIDIFTKYIWLYPVRNKGAIAMRAAMEQWLRDVGAKPEKFVTDQGNEFTNQQVQQLLRQNNIHWFPALGTVKAAIAERANRSIQYIIYKHLTENETLKYIDVLPQLVQTYNTRGHRTLEGMSPQEADRPENENHIRAIFHQRFYERGMHRRTSLPLKVGDLVRVKTEAKKISSSTRGYAEQFHGKYYKIRRINRTLPIALYYLRDFDTGDLIEGGFYKEELQLQRGDEYRIERVLNRRVRNGRREMLVKWKYFGDRWNEWIPERGIRRVF